MNSTDYIKQTQSMALNNVEALLQKYTFCSYIS